MSLSFFCRSQGCKTLVPVRGSFCGSHQHKQAEQKSFFHKDTPECALYNTSRWRTLRKIIIAEHPYCSVIGCGNTERLEVDHIQQPGTDEAMFFDPVNLRVVCKRHHVLRTLADIRARRAGQ